MSGKFTQLTPNNYHSAFTIHQRCHLFPWSESVFKDCLTTPYFASQIEIDNTVVGYFVGMAVAGEGTLMDIGVIKTHRLNGMGQLLMTEFIQQAKANLCGELWLEVRESNRSAIKLYERNKFTHIEARKGYYQTQTGRENGLIMRALLVEI